MTSTVCTSGSAARKSPSIGLSFAIKSPAGLRSADAPQSDGTRGGGVTAAQSAADRSAKVSRSSSHSGVDSVEGSAVRLIRVVRVVQDPDEDGLRRSSRVLGERVGPHWITRKCCVGLTINDEHFGRECVTGVGPGCGSVDPKTLGLVRIAALVAVGGAGPSFGAFADAAVSAGATAAEIVDVLVGIVSVVGLPCVVAAAPLLAMPLGYDVDAALEQQPGG